jgi:hypothetical protein
MNPEKPGFCWIGMSWAALVFVLCCSSCCVGMVTKVRNKTDKEISLTVIDGNQNPAPPVTIPAGSSRLCSGVWLHASWIVSDGKSQFVFNDVSPIGTMLGKSRTESRFTSMFPCNRVTQHVELETNMAIYAVGGVGQKISQPPGFPIRCTSTNTNLAYDKTRHDRMQRIIDGSTNKLLGSSLPDASRWLSLENVKWDEGYTSVPFGQLRVYHFKGFYLLLDLRVLPRGITPGSDYTFSVRGNSELRSNGVWWVANFYPSLHIDGIDDPKERMSNYWEQVHAGFGERTKQLAAARLQPIWVKFAFSVSNHVDDLTLLQKKLQAAQIRCSPPVSNVGTASFQVESNDFARARTVAAKIIRQGSLTVKVEADINGWGYEIWANGKKAGTVNF